MKSEDDKNKPGAIISTTPGRVIFNMMLPKGMDFYNTPFLVLRSERHGERDFGLLPKIGTQIDDQLAGRHEPTPGFRESTRSGLSFATDDLVTPGSKTRILQEAEKTVLKFRKLYERGVITELERYNQVLDTWTHAREQITGEMLTAMEHDDRGGHGYVNPVFLMAHSGARGGIEQIRQLAGMRGLMAKPNGEIIETPIKANFREGLTKVIGMLSARRTVPEKVWPIPL